MICAKPRVVSRGRFLFSMSFALLFPLFAAFSPAEALVQDERGFDPSTFGVGFELLADGFSRPVQVVDPGDGSGRLFVVEQGGTVRIVRDSVVAPGPFLDISRQVSTDNEQGLLSIAFHPDFVNNQTLFIDYTDLDGNTRIERWQVSAGNADLVAPDSVRTILELEQPYPNHNGGLILFGPDGCLYVGLGDGGSQGDPHGNGQNTGTLLGKILRIDVDRSDGDRAYGIPEDNPFADGEPGAPEVWAYGLRNPWRFSFDRETGDLFIGDVGQNLFEEISLLAAGSAERNFGWNIMEGFSCYERESCDQSGLMPPIFDYSHETGGCSVVGGYVYRGEANPALRGVYLFADYCSGLLWGLGQADDGGWVASAPINTGFNMSSFGEDARGELYAVDLNGGVYRIVAKTR